MQNVAALWDHLPDGTPPSDVAAWIDRDGTMERVTGPAALAEIGGARVQRGVQSVDRDLTRFQVHGSDPVRVLELQMVEVGSQLGRLTVLIDRIEMSVKANADAFTAISHQLERGLDLIQSESRAFTSSRDEMQKAIVGHDTRIGLIEQAYYRNLGAFGVLGVVGGSVVSYVVGKVLGVHP